MGSPCPAPPRWPASNSVSDNTPPAEPVHHNPTPTAPVPLIRKEKTNKGKERKNQGNRENQPSVRNIPAGSPGSSGSLLKEKNQGNQMNQASVRNIPAGSPGSYGSLLKEKNQWNQMNQALVRGTSPLVLLVCLVLYKGKEPVKPDAPGISARNITAGSPGSSGSLKFLRVCKQGKEGYRCWGKSLVSTILASPLHPFTAAYDALAPTGT